MIKSLFSSTFLLLVILFSGFPILASAQSGTTISLAEPTLGEDLFARHVTVTRTGMTILGTWAVLNLAGGIAGRNRTQGDTRYFHEMNAAWNVVNLAIAGFSYFGLQGVEFLSVQESLTEAQKLDKLLLLNTGLDVAYIATGGLLIERGRRLDNPRLKGYGKSLILQGGFLFLFDIGLYAIHQQVTTDLLHLLGNEGVSPRVDVGLNSLFISSLGTESFGVMTYPELTLTFDF